MRRRSLVIAAFVVVASGAAVFAYRGELRDAYGRWQRGPVPPAITREEATRPPAAPAPAPSPEPSGPEPAANAPKPAPVPPPVPAPAPAAAINLQVVFVPQAPFKVWDALHEDACEEAAMVMLQTYAEGTTALSLDEMDRRLRELVDYETATYGDVPSISAQRAVEVMRDHLGLKARVVPIASLDDVKAEIAAGRPVILPADGRLLFNPNFRDGGPPYHMLVAKGYTARTIVTNDPGTRVGADYAYANDVLWKAVHDWNDGDVPHGAKVMIVVD